MPHNLVAIATDNNLHIECSTCIMFTLALSYIIATANNAHSIPIHIIRYTLNAHQNVTVELVNTPEAYIKSLMSQWHSPKVWPQNCYGRMHASINLFVDLQSLNPCSMRLMFIELTSN